MTTAKGNAAPPPDTPPAAAPGVYRRTQESEDFALLRRRFRSFTFPMTVGFCAWYLLYVLMSSYAPGFMGKVVFGNVNVAFVFGVLQFVSTFAIAWLYAKYAGARLDPEAERIKGEVEGAARPAGDRTEVVG